MSSFPPLTQSLTGRRAGGLGGVSGIGRVRHVVLEHLNLTVTLLSENCRDVVDQTYIVTVVARWERI